MIGQTKSIKRSVFLRLSAIVFTTGLIINLVLFFGIRSLFVPPKGAPHFFEQSMSFYLNALADELGSTPSKDQILKLSERTHIGIVVVTPQETLKSDDKLPVPEDFPPPGEMRPRPPPRGIPGFGPPRGPMGFPVRMIEKGSTRFIFFPPAPPDMGPNYPLIISMLVIFTSLLCISYLLIRKMLRPIRDLDAGVQALSEGKFSHKIRVTGSNEFADLANAFNSMSSNIRDMVSAKERLLVDVSHELKSPLARMRVAVELLPDHRHKELIQGNVMEMDKIITHILESSRLEQSLEQLKLVSCDLSSIASKQYEQYLDRGQSLRLDLGEDEVLVKADVVRFTALLRNLIDNSLKYAKNDKEPIVISVRKEQSHAILSVKDQGVGIPDEDLALVFEPFYQVDKSRSDQKGSYGFGLSLCKRIVEAHHGSIEILSGSKHPGTTVNVRIPLA